MKELLDRFCRYVKVDTTAVDNAGRYPSSDGQLELGKMLAEELRDLKLKDVSMSEHGIVMATIPATKAGAPTIGWLAHVDTSPETTGKNVKPIIHQNYDGKDITLPGDTSKVIGVEDSPHLRTAVGKTVITTDGTTLLGADDKSGVAVVMTAADYLMSHTEIEHGAIRVCYSCDEEIGHGTDHIDLDKMGCVVAYTLDGETPGILEAETFSADLATVTVTGRNIHPGLAKDKMVNAIRIVSEFISRMPWQTMSPETTADREPFMHPYDMTCSVAEAKINIILRSFDTPDLAKQAQLLRDIAAGLEAEHPRASVTVETKEQYRNMAEGLAKEPRAAAKAQAAMKNLGMECEMNAIRGGTDGSQLTAKGLPTPNLPVGMHNFHSPLEYAVLEEMQQGVDLLIELAKVWAKP